MAVQKIKAHVQTRHEWSVPRWALYVAGALVLVATIYGGVQQFRVWRWETAVSSYFGNDWHELALDKTEWDKQSHNAARWRKRNR